MIKVVGNAERTSQVFWVIETENGQQYLGRIRHTNRYIFVYTGFAGRPKKIDPSDVETMVQASKHPDVTFERTS